MRREERDRRGLAPVLLATALASVVFVAARADVVICTDNTRYEGDVTEKGDLVVVKTEKGVVRLERAKVAEILRTESSLVDRFRASPGAKDLLILASRAGVPMKIEQAEKLVEKVLAGEDPSVQAELLLHGLRLTPEHTRAIVERHVAEFRKEYGDRGAVYEGEHYVVLTPLGAYWARKVGLRMDGIFEEYQKRLEFKEKVTDRFVVKVYGSQAEYAARGALPGSVACFSSVTRELVAFRQPADDLLFESLYHEGMHQFLHFYVPTPPIWFDEGLAQYFETARPSVPTSDKKPAYVVGRVKRLALEYMKRSLRSRSTVSLRKLISMEKDEFYGGRKSLYYSKAWAFTHFLVESKDKRLRKLWFDYFFALRDGADQEEVNRKVFGRVDLDRLDRMLQRYTERLKFR